MVITVDVPAKSEAPAENGAFNHPTIKKGLQNQPGGAGFRWPIHSDQMVFG